MSTPTVLRPDVVAFAAQVRAHLDDLPPDVVEELAGGLDADLAELAAESDDPLQERLGDPVAYAAELREAAELPARRADADRPGLLRRVAGGRAAIELWARQLPGWPWIVGFAAAVRPLWWVLRAWVAWQLAHYVFAHPSVLGSPLPNGTMNWILLLIAVVGSIELGRRTWRARWLRAALLVANVVALVVLPLAVEHASSSSGAVSSSWAETYPSPPPMGLYLDGQPIANLFPYGPDGQPLSDVRLLDDRGRAVTPGEDIRSFPAGNGWLALVPAQDADSKALWNAYPLREARTEEWGERPGPLTEIRPAPLPEASLAPLTGSEPVAAQATSGEPTP